MPEMKEKWWFASIRIFSQVSAWVAGPIILALILGKWLDRKFETKPWFFLAATGIAFLVSLRAIWKILVKYIKEIEKNGKPSGTNN